METTPPTIIDEMLRPFATLTPQAAAEVAQLKTPDTLQQRVAVLAEKNNAGAITDEELEEYQTYVKYGNVLAVIKAKARMAAAERS